MKTTWKVKFRYKIFGLLGVLHQDIVGEGVGPCPRPAPYVPTLDPSHPPWVSYTPTGKTPSTFPCKLLPLGPATHTVSMVCPARLDVGKRPAQALELGISTIWPRKSRVPSGVQKGKVGIGGHILLPLWIPDTGVQLGTRSRVFQRSHSGSLLAWV